MRRFISVLTEGLVKPLNPASIILLGLFTVLWGTWIILPFWNVFATAPMFHALLEIAPEWAWGLNAITCGALTTYGVHSRRYKPLASGIAVATWHWSIIALFCFLGDWQNAGGLVYLFLGVCAALTRLNLKLSRKSDTPIEKMFID